MAKRWNMKQDTRQRFNELREDGWTLRSIAVTTGLTYAWLESYAKNKAVSPTVDNLQEIYDLYEDYYL